MVDHLSYGNVCILSRTHHVTYIRTLHLSVHGNENESLESEGSQATSRAPSVTTSNENLISPADVHTASRRALENHGETLPPELLVEHVDELLCPVVHVVNKLPALEPPLVLIVS
jgi:hypothetical protein